MQYLSDPYSAVLQVSGFGFGVTYCWQVDPEYPNVTYFKAADVSQHPAWQKVLNPTVSQELVDAYLDYDTDEDEEIQNPQLNVYSDPSAPNMIIHQTDNVDFACRLLRAQRERQEGPKSIKSYRPNFEGVGSYWTKRAEKFTGLKGPIAVRKFREMKEMKYKEQRRVLPDFDGQLTQEVIHKQLDHHAPEDLGEMKGLTSAIPNQSGLGGLGPVEDNRCKSTMPGAAFQKYPGDK